MNRLHFKIFKHSYEYIRQWNEIIIIDMIYNNALASNKTMQYCPGREWNIPKQAIKYCSGRE